MSRFVSNAIYKHFENFIADYRKRSTRLDARVLFRMELNALAPQISDEIITKIIKSQNEFITNYLSYKNIFRRAEVRRLALADFTKLTKDLNFSRPVSSTETKENTPAPSISPIEFDKSQDISQDHEIGR